MNPVKKQLEIASKKKAKTSLREQERDLSADTAGNKTDFANPLEMLLESHTAMLGDSLKHCRVLIQKADLQIEEILKQLYNTEDNDFKM
jgi:hypothetical protein